MEIKLGRGGGHEEWEQRKEGRESETVRVSNLCSYGEKNCLI